MGVVRHLMRLRQDGISPVKTVEAALVLLVILNQSTHKKTENPANAALQQKQLLLKEMQACMHFAKTSLVGGPTPAKARAAARFDPRLPKKETGSETFFFSGACADPLLTKLPTAAASTRCQEVRGSSQRFRRESSRAQKGC